MKNIVDPKPPFKIGERIAPINPMGWNYVELAGIPEQLNVPRRYVKGMMVTELLTFSNIKRSARESEDKQWREERVYL